MRVLDTFTLEMAEFPDMPPHPYAILSHTWGDGEILLREYSSWRSEEKQDVIEQLQLMKSEDFRSPPPPDLCSVSTPTDHVLKPGYRDSRMWTSPWHRILNLKPGLRKVVEFCAMARENGFRYAWVDTCCIDKCSMVEVTEAVNSAYRWYHQAAICYAYLVDIPQASDAGSLVKDGQSYIWRPTELFTRCRWFTRGWTLQELIAPPVIAFHAADWSKIGTKSSLLDQICDITRVNVNVLTGDESPLAHNAAHIMSWAAHRATSRVEDIAYCLISLFELAMVPVYGEGPRAFIRLQEEILSRREDMSLLFWNPHPESQLLGVSMSFDDFVAGDEEVDALATSPDAFYIHRTHPHDYSSMSNTGTSTIIPGLGGSMHPAIPWMTVSGLQLTLHLVRWPSGSSAEYFLACLPWDFEGDYICLVLKLAGGSPMKFRRRANPRAAIHRMPAAMLNDLQGSMEAACLLHTGIRDRAKVRKPITNDSSVQGESLSEGHYPLVPRVARRDLPRTNL